MENEDNDIALVERVKNGDKKAFNLLVSKYQYRIKHLVARFVKDPVEQEDIVQEAFIKAYRAIGRFRGDSAFYTWLYRIAVNSAKNYIVAAGRRPPSQDIDADEIAHTRHAGSITERNSPEEILQNDELVAAIREAIRLLPHELKEAIQLREFDGLSYEDIAAVMDCPIGTVRSRIFRAREAIEQAISAISG
ncbi:MAG: RNA polymerase sigma factor RpoE [Gammaproteobacteria bacterium]|nr:RNA polymerase sigma factor RpoE [Gammaproteobacteria bacterium]